MGAASHTGQAKKFSPFILLGYSEFQINPLSSAQFDTSTTMAILNNIIFNTAISNISNV